MKKLSRLDNLNIFHHKLQCNVIPLYWVISLCKSWNENIGRNKMPLFGDFVPENQCINLSLAWYWCLWFSVYQPTYSAFNMNTPWAVYLPIDSILIEINASSSTDGSRWETNYQFNATCWLYGICQQGWQSRYM